MADLDSDDNKIEATQVRELIRACGPLLRIYSVFDWDDYYPGSQRVTFIHPMAKDALLRQASSRKLIGLSEDGDDQTEVKWQHGILALRCFRYVLAQLGVEDSSSSWNQDSDSVNTESAQDKDEKILSQIFPDEDKVEEDALYALDYPVKFWLRHGNDSTPDFVETLDLSHAFWSLESSARSRWWLSYAQVAEFSDLKNLTPMHVAAFFGLTPLINQIVKPLGNADQVHGRDSWHHQPLHWAAFQGHDVTVLRLLEIGADVNDGAFDYVRTPLHMAAESGQIRTMELLLERGAEVNSVAKGEGTPLTLALAWNREQAAELLLLSYGASSTLTSEDFESPMALAALKGFEGVITHLLNTSGVQNMTSKKYGNALAAAASAGHSSIVSKLLPFEKETESRQRAVTEAAQNGYDSIVRVILSDTHNLNINDGFEFAASLGHDQVLKTLWAYHEANGTLSPNSLNNALFKAVNNEHEVIVQFLLGECGASANATGEEYGNAVTASAFDGTTKILDMLIKANVNLNDTVGWPLQAAASQGMIEVVEMLLRSGAAVNAVSDKFSDGTALQAAVVAGHYDIAKLLLDNGADANLGAGPFTNPITAAVSCRHSSLIELLLSRRANPNVFGGSDNSTPLIHAALKLPAKDLEVLISYGARVDTADPDEDTALIISAYFADDDCVKCLLNHRANINFCGKKRGTALHAAAARGHVETFRLLLNLGADPTIRGGPYDTVLQAACSGGEREVVQLALCAESIRDLTLRKTLRRYRHRIDVDARSQTSEFSTALHAAAVQQNDACLRLLLKQKPDVNAISKNNITPLQAACLSGCNRNARLLLEAGAKPNMAGGAHGTALQAAALKCSPELISVLLERGARTTEWRGKYYSPLVAAVVRDYHHPWNEADVLSKLLAKDFPTDAYRAALERAFFLGRKNAFKLIWKSAEEKGPKKLPNLGLKSLLTYYTDLAQQREVSRAVSPWPHQKEEDENEDFSWSGWDSPQDIEDDVVYTDEMDETEETEDGQTQTRGARMVTARSTTRGMDGGADVGEGGFYGQQDSQGDTNGSGAGYQPDLPIELSPDGDGQRSVGDAGLIGADDQDATNGEIEGEQVGDEEVGDDVTREIDNGEESAVQGDNIGVDDHDDQDETNQGMEGQEGETGEGIENEDGVNNVEVEEDGSREIDNGYENDAQADDTVQEEDAEAGVDRAIVNEGIDEPNDQDGDTLESDDTPQAVDDQWQQEEVQQEEVQQYEIPQEVQEEEVQQYDVQQDQLQQDETAQDQTQEYEAHEVYVEPADKYDNNEYEQGESSGSGATNTHDDAASMFSAIGDVRGTMAAFRDARHKFIDTEDGGDRAAAIGDATAKVSKKFSHFMRSMGS